MLPEEVTRFIGQSSETRIFEVEKGAIKRFADAVGDPNPLYWDEEYARNSAYGAIIAPPGFFGWPARPMGKSFMFFGQESEFFGSVRGGDTLAASTVIKNITERKGQTGQLAFVIRETTYLNQNGALVAKARQTVIHR